MTKGLVSMYVLPLLLIQDFHDDPVVNGTAPLCGCGTLSPERASLAVLDICPVGFHDSPVDALVAENLVIGADVAIVFSIIAEFLLRPDFRILPMKIRMGDKGFDTKRQKSLVTQFFGLARTGENPRVRVGTANVGRVGFDRVSFALLRFLVTITFTSPPPFWGPWSHTRRWPEWTFR